MSNPVIPERSKHNYTIEVSEEQKPQRSNGGFKVIAKGATAGAKAAGSVFSDFKKFIDKGNVVNLAVGIAMGTAFTNIVNSLVKDMLTPLIALAGNANLENRFAVLKDPKNVCSGNQTICTTTPEIAQSNGIITLNWGNFINTVIQFFIISLILFFIVKTYCVAFRVKEPPVKTQPCTYCAKDIPITAKRCPKCTSYLEVKQE